MTFREWLDTPCEQTFFGRTLAGTNRWGRVIELWIYPMLMFLAGYLACHAGL
jgi:hypothetical protein